MSSARRAYLATVSQWGLHKSWSDCMPFHSSGPACHTFAKSYFELDLGSFHQSNFNPN
jgi:hypothetical protein